MSTNAFVSHLASQIASNRTFVDRVAETVLSGLTGSRGGAVAKAPKAPVGRPPGKGAAKKAAGKGGRRSIPKGAASDLVLDAIRGGASTRTEVLKKTGVTLGGYSYAIKTLKSKGVVKVLGSRGQAKVVLA